MSALIQTVFILVGAFAGKTIRLGKWLFTDGELTLNATPEDTALIARSLERNWSAYPKGHPALAVATQEPDNGKRDLSSQGTRPDGTADVPGGVQSEGEGPAAGSEGGDGGGHDDAPARPPAELAQGNGQSEGLTDPAPEKEPEPKADANTKLQKAIDQLSYKNDDHWTREGKPAMTAVESFYGSTDITRADVDAAAPGYDRRAAKAKAKA